MNKAAAMRKDPSVRPPAAAATKYSPTSEATRFLEWCRFNGDHFVEALDREDKKRFESGKLPEKLLSAVSSAWSNQLKSHLPWDEHFAVVRKALPNPNDYHRYMKSPWGQHHGLPKRIRSAVERKSRKRLKEIHAAFVANAGEKRLKTYVRVWQSQKQALLKLIIQARGYTCKEGGGASIGEMEIDIERMLLSEAEASGSVMGVHGLLPFIESLWERDKTVIVRTTTGFDNKIIPNPDRSGPRLNRFFIKLGRALAATKKRRELPDWLHMDQTLRFIVHGWCENIIVDGETWPALCFLTTPALARFLTLCNPQRWKETQDPRTLERAIVRLGLVKIPKGRIKHVEKKCGQFSFT